MASGTIGNMRAFLDSTFRRVCWLFVTIALCLPVSVLATSPSQSPAVAETYRQAYDVGYQDGLTAGQKDHSEGHLFDLANHKDYQQAERGFDQARHDREVYQVAYRRGFEDGYEEGYQLESSPAAAEMPPVSPVPSGEPARKPPVSAVKKAPVPDLPGSSVALPSGTRIEIELRDTLSTKYNERGDDFRARVLDDVVVDDQVLIPTGTEIYGAVSHLKRAGRVRGRAQINLRFDEIRFVDGRRAVIDANVVGIERRSGEQIKQKDGEGVILAPGGKGDDAKSIGKASGVGGLIGLISGGGRGAAVGATAGAVAGLAGVLFSRGRDAILESGTQLTIELIQPAEVPERSRP